MYSKRRFELDNRVLYLYRFHEKCEKSVTSDPSCEYMGKLSVLIFLYSHIVVTLKLNLLNFSFYYFVTAEKSTLHDTMESVFDALVRLYYMKIHCPTKIVAREYTQN